jgi:hypothetical protein
MNADEIQDRQKRRKKILIWDPTAAVRRRAASSGGGRVDMAADGETLGGGVGASGVARERQPGRSGGCHTVIGRNGFMNVNRYIPSKYLM